MNGHIMNGYLAHYQGKKIYVSAYSSYEAQKKGAEYFKAKKTYDVTAILVECQGKEIIHSTGSL